MSPGTPCEGLDAALWLNGKGEGLADSSLARLAVCIGLMAFGAVAPDLPAQIAIEYVAILALPPHSLAPPGGPGSLTAPSGRVFEDSGCLIGWA
jgi:hypothetical protein